MCEDFDFDNVFLLIMTAVSAFICFIDGKVLEKMFEEHFMMRRILSRETYMECWK